MKKKLLLGLLIWAGVIGLVWARPDFSIFPEPIKPGSVQVSLAGPALPSFIYASSKDTESSYEGVLFGGLARVEYALPVPFTLGIEGGYFTGKLYASRGVRFSAVPLMGRFSWHPNMGLKNLDIYTGVKMGANMLSYSGSYDGETGNITGSDYNTSWGFAFGSDCGVRYFFTSAFGMFVDFDVTFIMRRMQDTNIMTIHPRPSVGLTVNL